MTGPIHRGVDVPGVRVPAAKFVHATMVPAGADLLFVSGQTPEDIDGSVPDDRRPALTVLVTDHWDERWLIEIEVVAARQAAGPGETS